MAVIKDLGAVTAYASAVEGGYTGTKAEFETLMASYATVAEEAAESAESASTSATQAGASAQTATTKAGEASTSATQAGASATSASQSAQTATTKASEASASAIQAGTKASEASTSASMASSKASEASAGATSAQIAQGLAEVARDDAVDAKTDAESARDLAQQYAESIDPENIYSAYPTDTASGSVVSFADGADGIPFKSCVVAIEPVQSGSGNPSPDNVRPISGWTGAQVGHSGADRTNPTTYSITFPSEAGTVYGGVLDVTNGTLTVDRVFATKKWGQMSSVYSGTTHSTKSLNFDANVLKGGQNSITNITAAYIEKTTEQSTHYYVSSDMKTVYVTLPNDTNSDTDIQVCGTLEEAIVYTLTPTEIKSLLGDNNVWADAGDTTVTYRADTAMYINKKIAEVINALS